MKISDMMTRDVEVVRPDASVPEAARKMKSLDVGSLPVCDGQRLVGMITDRDITIRAVADSNGRKLDQIAVKDVMTDKVIYCFEDEDIAEAARVMSDEQIRRLPIISRDKKLVGILALGDLAVDSQDRVMSGQTLQHISKPAEPAR
jgi:CBS domain-containing protein